MFLSVGYRSTSLASRREPNTWVGERRSGAGQQKKEAPTWVGPLSWSESVGFQAAGWDDGTAAFATHDECAVLPVL